MILDKPLSDITEEDLNFLVSEKISEGKNIDYKLELYSNSPKDKKEFLADITSFANSAGGYLLIGVEEKKGIPIKISGLKDIDTDHENQWMENLIRTSIEPRIANIQIQPIYLKNKNIVLIIKIPKSWSGPHVVKHEKHWRFYSRNSVGKYPLDVAEVRTSFNLSESIIERVQSFRHYRLNKIIANELPRKLCGNTIFVLHLIPFDSFDPMQNINLLQIMPRDINLRPISSSSYDDKFNFHGFLTFDKCHAEPECSNSYTQLFKNGCIEALSATFPKTETDKLLTITSFEDTIIDHVDIYLRALQKLSVNPPMFIMLSMFGYNNFQVYYSHRSSIQFHYHKLDEDNLIFDPIILNSFGDIISSLLKPIFDSLWNAFGVPYSLNYNEDGNRIE